MPQYNPYDPTHRDAVDTGVRSRVQMRDYLEEIDLVLKGLPDTYQLSSDEIMVLREMVQEGLKYEQTKK